MKKWADEGRRPVEFKVGDMVLIKLMSGWQSRPFRNRDGRLLRKYEGPMPIVAKVGRASYKVVLPEWLKVHPVFHVSNLKPYHPDEEDPARNQPTRASIDLKLPKTKEAEQILADRVRTTRSVRKGQYQPRQQVKEYLVKWKGLGEEETSWEKAETLAPYQHLIEEFEAAQSTRTSTD